jgi:branched-chain amino acid transport system permease protein
MRLPIFAYSGPRDWALVALAALVLALLPIVFDDPFFILVMQSLGYLFIATLGLDILVGWTGQISLGHAGLYAVGAYTSALAATRLGLPFWLSAPLGVTLAGLFGVALAVPSLRARGPYLAMVTIAFGFMAEVTSNRWSLTGGPMGIMSIPAPTLPSVRGMAPMWPRNFPSMKLAAKPPATAGIACFARSLIIDTGLSTSALRR